MVQKLLIESVKVQTDAAINMVGSIVETVN